MMLLLVCSDACKATHPYQEGAYQEGGPNRASDLVLGVVLVIWGPALVLQGGRALDPEGAYPSLGEVHGHGVPALGQGVHEEAAMNGK